MVALLLLKVLPVVALLPLKVLPAVALLLTEVLPVVALLPLRALPAVARTLPPETLRTEPPVPVAPASRFLWQASMSAAPASVLPLPMKALPWVMSPGSSGNARTRFIRDCLSEPCFRLLTSHF